MRYQNVITWLESRMVQPKPIPQNFVYNDSLAGKYKKILRFRELCRQDAAEAVRMGQPYSMVKLIQAERLLKLITEKLNARPTIFNRFNQN
jgi:hypothetical protein